MTTNTATVTYGAQPLEAARRALQDFLSGQFNIAGRQLTHGATAPRVVALGAMDILRLPLESIESYRTATVHLSADSVLVGPWGGSAQLGAAGARACGQCLAMRRQRLRPQFEREALETNGATPRATSPWPVLHSFTLDAVWAVYVAVVLSPHQPSAGLMTGGGQTDADLQLPQVSRVDLETLRVQSFPVLAEPLCPSCQQSSVGDHGEGSTEPAVLRLSSRAKPTPDTYRVRSAGTYAMPVQALANPVCGALGAGTSAEITSTTISAVSGRMVERNHADFHEISWSGLATSFDRSRSLALLEGLERYAGARRRSTTGVVVEAYRDLGAAALNPMDATAYSPETYHHDTMLTPFSPDQKIPWIWGYSLRDDRPILVPARMVYYGLELDATKPVPKDNFLVQTSSGCATGSCLEEAILFGMVELIERDAFLLGWYGGAQLTKIDLDSCRSRSVHAMLDRAALLDYDVHVFDNRIDLAVPVVTSLAVRRDGGTGSLGFAAGASLDPVTAIEAALGEVLSQVPHRQRQLARRVADIEAMALDFFKVRHLADHAGLFALPEMARHVHRYLNPAAVRSVDDVYREWCERRPRTLDLLDDVRLCLRELTQAGFDVIVVDQTSPEQDLIGLRTVRTIVPGLIPIDFGWSRQRVLRMDRLRSAFRRAGWRSTDLTEEQLHRVPHPFP